MSLQALKRSGWCRRRRRRRDEGPPRDEYMRGMVDFVGIQDRLNLDGTQAEARIREEFEDNQAESRTALQFAGARNAGDNRLWRHTRSACQAQSMDLSVQLFVAVLSPLMTFEHFHALCIVFAQPALRS